MVDLCDKGSDYSEDMNSQSSQQSQTTTTPDRGSSEGPQVRTCADCGTTKTPLWRGGPAGPKSLCNACGIRSRKKRRALLGLSKEDKKTKKPASTKNVSHQNNRSNNTSKNKGYESTSSTADSTSKYGGDTLKKKLFSFGRDVALQRPRSSTTQRRKLGEEEQAAFLLMALSCGSVYA